MKLKELYLLFQNKEFSQRTELSISADHSTSVAVTVQLFNVNAT